MGVVALRRPPSVPTCYFGPVDLETYSGSDFYCDVAIANPGQFDVIHEDDMVLAYHHTRPFWEVHIIAVPKRRIASLSSVTAADEEEMRALFQTVRTVAGAVEAAHGAAGVLTNLGNYQDSKHLHIHVHSGPRRGEVV